MTAQQLIRCEVDMRCYEMLIGRNLNHRLLDKSSIYNVPNYQKFLNRSKEPNPETFIKIFYKKELYSSFILHESMSNIKLYFETFPKMKCISIVRNPIDIAYSWYKRGLGKRWGTDPTLFQITFTKGSGNKVFPWFAVGWEDLYLELDEVNRAILSVKSLIEIARKSYHALPVDIKKRILVISFERLTSDPHSEITKISKFLGKKPLPEIKEILEREKLPMKEQKNKQEKKLKEIKHLAKKEYFDELLKLQFN